MTQMGENKWQIKKNNNNKKPLSVEVCECYCFCIMLQMHRRHKTLILFKSNNPGTQFALC